jgi:hypothetical protein
MLLKGADSRLRVLAHYAVSLRSTDWKSSTHPPFDDAFLQRCADNGCSTELTGS